jgi:hypothetical protein
MRIWRRAASAVVVLALAAGLAVSGPSSPANAATGGCYGASCNGLDPMGRCDSDAITVRAMDVTDGMLELRYSRSCAANWGRYTPYWRTVFGYGLMGIGIWARVTVWNPGVSSYGSAHNADPNPFASSWSYMTDGRPTACTGVEVMHTHGSGDNESMGWTWGPCY